MGARDLCHHLDVAATVLVVDDHPGFRGFARRLLEEAGFAVLDEGRWSRACTPDHNGLPG